MTLPKISRSDFDLVPVNTELVGVVVVAVVVVVVVVMAVLLTSYL